MTNIEDTIFSWEERRKLFSIIDKDNMKIVLCHGHYNVIHPGHIRFFKYAKELGDFVIASVYHENELEGLNKDQFFNQNERALGVAGLQFVDAVLLSNGNKKDLISFLTPDIYLKGKEFKNLINEEIEALKSVNCKLEFSSGEVEYARDLLSEEVDKYVENRKFNNFHSFLNRKKIDLDTLKERLQTFKNQKVLVIGDLIVDQFIQCDTLGVSSEAPVMVLRELSEKKFIGGAGIIAQNFSKLGAQCNFITVIGEDSIGNYINSHIQNQPIEGHLLVDKSRPTTFKIRYLVENQKILRVSRLKQHEIDYEFEEIIIKKCKDLIPLQTAVVISDFNYGILTKKIIQNILSIAKLHKIPVYADCQCSSQIGDITKFRPVSLITPTEKEARISLNDNTSGLEKLATKLMDMTQNENLAITLGSKGVLVFTKNNENYESEYCDALETNPVDVAGAGDAMLVGYVLSMGSGLNIWESTALASIFSAISVKRMGNVPLSIEEIYPYIDSLNLYYKGM